MEWLKNKYVLIGAVILFLVVVMRSRGNATESAAAFPFGQIAAAQAEDNASARAYLADVARLNAEVNVNAQQVGLGAFVKMQELTASLAGIDAALAGTKLVERSRLATAELAGRTEIALSKINMEREAQQGYWAERITALRENAETSRAVTIGSMQAETQRTSDWLDFGKSALFAAGGFF